MRIPALVLAFLISLAASAAEPRVERFLFIGGSDAREVSGRLNAEIDGVQIIYPWRGLEPAQDRYDFEKISRDLAFLEGKGKKLWIQLQDRFFDPKSRSVPDYLLNQPIYEGGLARQKDNPGEGAPEGAGWVTKQWNPHVRSRFQKLIAELARRFDGRVYGINLPESAADVDIEAESRKGFSCDGYFAGTLENIRFARKAFTKSRVVQYVNFWPCEWDNDHRYMSRFFEAAASAGFGLGGPDIVPYRKGQMKNSYPFFHQYRGKLPIVAFAVQEPTRTYVNPKTGKAFTEGELLDFGTNYLGANLIFWSAGRASGRS